MDGAALSLGEGGEADDDGGSFKPASVSIFTPDRDKGEGGEGVIETVRAGN